MIPPIKRIGMKTAMSERLIDSTVKPTSRAPMRAASRRPLPASMWRLMFSRTTIASSTTKPVAMVRAISDKLFKLKFEEIHRAEGADDRNRHGDDWNDRCAYIAQEQKHNSRNQKNRDDQGPFGVVQGGANCFAAIRATRNFNIAWH